MYVVCFVRLWGEDFVARFLPLMILYPLQTKSYFGKHVTRRSAYTQAKNVRYLIPQKPRPQILTSTNWNKDKSKAFFSTDDLFLYVVFYVFYYMCCIVFMFWLWARCIAIFYTYLLNICHCVRLTRKNRRQLTYLLTYKAACWQYHFVDICPNDSWRNLVTAVLAIRNCSPGIQDHEIPIAFSIPKFQSWEFPNFGISGLKIYLLSNWLKTYHNSHNNLCRLYGAPNGILLNTKYASDIVRLLSSIC